MATDINNTKEISRIYKEWNMGDEWIQNMNITSSHSKDYYETVFDEINPQNMKINNVTNDEFKREFLFLKEAEDNVKIALNKLLELHMPIIRPSDYFAEMLKSDEHMNKVKQNVIKRVDALERTRKVSEIRKMKKFGKKVQQEILKKRDQQKLSSKSKIKRLSKKYGSDLQKNINNDYSESFQGSVRWRNTDKNSHKAGKKLTRKQRDLKFGYGNFLRNGANGKTTKNKRPGKVARLKSRAKK